MVSIMTDKLDIKSILKNFDLTTKEAKVYKSLLNNGTTSILELSRQTKDPRTTIYRIAETLVNKNFAEWVVEGHGKKIRPVTPDRLEHLIEDKKLELEKSELALSSLKELYAKLPVKGLPQTQIRYYKGISGMKQLLWNTLDAKRETVGYSVYSRHKLIGKAFHIKFILEFKRRGLKDRVIVNEETAPRAIKTFEENLTQKQVQPVRVIPDLEISGDTYIYNNIYAVNFWEGGEVIGVEIENPEIAKIQKSIFEKLWKAGTLLRDFKG